MEVTEQPVVFRCRDARLLGILHRPVAAAKRGVLILVGGPQYRIGSHRQFLLLARQVAGTGTAVLRFDYRGMGDSEGPAITFEDAAADMTAAIDAFVADVPELEEVVIWGLCDAASAAMMYAHRDARVSGLVLLNPWVRTEAGASRTYLRHYYAAKLRDPASWRRLLGGGLDIRRALGSFLQHVRNAWSGGDAAAAEGVSSAERPPFPAEMRSGLARFRGPVLLVLSGQDLTAAEFLDEVADSRAWRELLAAPRVRRLDLPEANHTFASRQWRDQVARWTEAWLRSW